MISYATYLTATGEITAVGQCPDDHLTIQASAGESAIQIDGIEITSASHYVLAGVVTARPSMALSGSAITFVADGVAGYTVTGIPTNATAKIEVPDGGVVVADFAVADGNLTVNSFVKGNIYLTIMAFPYLDFNVLLVAT